MFFNYKSIFFYLLFLFSLETFSFEITIMSIHDSKSITTAKKYKFSISEATGNWQDSLGNYGKSKILFYLENKYNEETYIKGLGRLTDQNKNSIWFIPIRKSDEKAGVGKIEVLETSDIYNF